MLGNSSVEKGHQSIDLGPTVSSLLRTAATVSALTSLPCSCCLWRPGPFRRRLTCIELPLTGSDWQGVHKVTKASPPEEGEFCISLFSDTHIQVPWAPHAFFIFSIQAVGGPVAIVVT